MLSGIDHAKAIEQTIQQFTVIDLKHRRSGGQTCGLETGHSQGNDFSVGFGAVGADGIGIALHELTQTARPRFFVAPHRPESVAAERLGKAVPVLGRKARQRRCVVVTQRHPLLIIILNREHPDIGAVGIGQEFAECISIFKGRSLQGLKAEILIDLRYRRDQSALGRDLGAALIGKTTWRARFGTEIFGISCFFGHAVAIEHPA